MEHSMMIY